MNENKKTILKALFELLKECKEYKNLESITYDAENDRAVIKITDDTKIHWCSLKNTFDMDIVKTVTDFIKALLNN